GRERNVQFTSTPAGRNAQIAVIARRRSNRPGLSRQAGRKRSRHDPTRRSVYESAARLAHMLLHATHIFGGGPARRCSRHRSALAWALDVVGARLRRILVMAK